MKQLQCLPLLVLLVLLMTTYCISQEDWGCSSPCKCKWASGKKTAECIRKNLNRIPETLSSEIQNLDLTGNRIVHLHEDAFSRVNLVNLHKLSLRECDIELIHTKAFMGLKIVIEIDLSENQIKYLHAGTFAETQRLRVLLLNGNQLESLKNGLFDNLTYLQKIVLSNNRIKRIGEKTFQKLPGLQTLTLDGNNLSNVSLVTFEMLPKLGSLDLRNNPWNCSCDLKNLRDWTIERKLYTKPTRCERPLHLSEKMWDEVSSDEFACQPRIKTIIPSTRIVQVEKGDEARLSCLAVGIPQPRVHWVHRSRILNNSTRRHGGGGGDGVADSEKVGYFLTEISGWVNLTVPDVTLADKGEYACVAQSPGGFAGENVTLVVISDSSNGGRGGDGSDSIFSLPVALGLGVSVLLFFLVTMTLCVFYCRRRQTTLNDEKSHHEIGVGTLEQHGLGEQEKSLITAINSPSAGAGATTAVIAKPSRRYDSPSVTSHGTEMTELNRTLLDNDSVFGGGMGGIITNGIRTDDDDDDDDDRGRATPELGNGTLFRGTNHFINSSSSSRHYPPDLLAFSGGRGASPTSQASTAPDNSRLPNQHLFGPFAGSPSSQQYTASGGGFKTLPHNRSGTPYSIVGGGSGGSGGGGGGTIPILPRQGYVTIPRRPRAPSWSSGPPTSPTEVGVAGGVEPVYDNLGLRTTADGSSVISLNKSPEPPVGPMRGGGGGGNRPLPVPPSNIHNHSIQLGTPNILSNTTTTNNNNNNNSINNNSISSELDRSAPEGAAEWPILLANEMETCHPEQEQQQQSAIGSIGRKVPPRPPPKPKKKNANGPLYEDEGEDGTEV